MKFDTNIDWVQVARYFSGEMSPEERAVIESLIDSDARYREAVAYARRVWDATGRPVVGVDKQQAWKAVDSEIEKSIPSREPLRLIRRDRSPEDRDRSRTFNHHASNWAIVSTLLILVLGVYFFGGFDSTEEPPSEVAMFKTTAGQRATVTLPDGSKALLNAESQIQVLTSPSDPTRVIKLEGEAYFSVLSDPDRPFFVQAGGAEIRVIGTSFNVSAYPEMEDIKVLVTEGTVQLSKNGAPSDSVLLVKNDMGVVASEGVPILTRGVPVEKMLAWREGDLVFESANFMEVARTLERWFDLDVHISDLEIRNRHLSSSFEDPTPNHVISVIASTLSLEYSIQENTVTFFISESP